MKKWLLPLLLLSVSTFFVQMALAEKVAHKEYASMSLADCASCHKGEGVAPNHDDDWTRGHRVLASKAGNNCGQCHAQSWCLDCHTGGGIERDLSTRTFGRNYVPKSHRTNFMSIHPVKALDNPQTCNRCHEPSYCNDCHSRFPRGSMRIKSHLMGGAGINAARFSDHPTEARRNLQSCQACHPDGDVCIQCHSSGKTNPHPRGWSRIKNNYSDRAGKKTCVKCHLPGTY